MTELALPLAALDEDKVTPGLLGFTVVAILALATWVLLRSMTRQMKRIDFEEKDTRPSEPPADDAPRPDGDTADATARHAVGADDREAHDNSAR